MRHTMGTHNPSPANYVGISGERTGSLGLPKQRWADNGAWAKWWLHEIIQWVIEARD